MLPVRGIKMKVLAEHCAGLTTVILPNRNDRDLDELAGRLLGKIGLINDDFNWP